MANRSESENATPEADRELLLAIVTSFALGQSPNDAADRIETAAPGVTSWTTVGRLLDQHGCSLIAYRQFSLPEVRARVAPPDDLLSTLRTRYSSGFARFYAVLPVLRELTDAFAGSGIPAMAFKGIAVGAFLYGDPVLREYSDLDFVVPESRAADVHAMLLDRGFVCVDDPFRRPPRYGGESLRSATYCRRAELCVDLRFDPLRILWRSKGTREELFARWWERRQQVVVGDITVQMPGTEDQFLQLARHLQAHDYAMAKWAVDVLLLLRRHGAELDWQRIGRESRIHGIHGGLYRTLEILNRIYEAPIPPTAWTALRPNAVVRSLHRRVWPESLSLHGNAGGAVTNLTPQSLTLASLRNRRQLSALALFIVDRNRAQNLVYLTRRLFPSRAWLLAAHGDSSGPRSSYATLWRRHVRAGVLRDTN